MLTLKDVPKAHTLGWQSQTAGLHGVAIQRVGCDRQCVQIYVLLSCSIRKAHSVQVPSILKQSNFLQNLNLHISGAQGDVFQREQRSGQQRMQLELNKKHRKKTGQGRHPLLRKGDSLGLPRRKQPCPRALGRKGRREEAVLGS